MKLIVKLVKREQLINYFAVY